MPTIRQNLTNVNFNARGTAPKWIVVHNTANYTSEAGTAYNNTEYFKDVYRKSSAHYFIDDGDVIWQCVRDTDTAWHVGEAASRNGCYNYNAIGIEVCENADGSFTDNEVRTLSWLVRKLMDEYGIPEERVCRHHDVTGKDCPRGYIADSAWASLKAAIINGDSERYGVPMEFIFHPDQCGHLFYVCGGNISYIPHEDGVKELDWAYKKCNGTDLPHLEDGSPDAPWGFRLFQAMGHEDLYQEIVYGEKPETPAPTPSQTAQSVDLSSIGEALAALGEALKSIRG